MTSLAESAVKYYYVPKSAIKGNKLPLHLMVPQGNGKGAIEYTLVAARTQSLNETGNASAPAAGSGFSCTVANIKTEAAAVFTKWDGCLTASDYKKPNGNAKRRLLSAEPAQRARGARTQSLKWVWVPQSAGEKMTAAPFQSLNETGGNASAAAGGGNTLSECEKKAIGDTCTKLAGCSDPVCINYYNEPEIERICGICTMAAGGGGWGCFASSAQVVEQARGPISVSQLKVGDYVEAAGPGGARAFSRVYFMHEHRDVFPTVKIQHAAGELELTANHALFAFSEQCGDRFCAAAPLMPAKSVRTGDRVYVAGPEGLTAQVVSAVVPGTSRVHYVLTEADNLVVGGVLASVLSTAAGALESLPFFLLDRLLPGILQTPAVAAALATVLESPLLRGAEALIDSVVAKRPAAPVARAPLAVPASAF